MPYAFNDDKSKFRFDIDATLSGTSSNAIQNKAVVAALDKKADKTMQRVQNLNNSVGRTTIQQIFDDIVNEIGIVYLDQRIYKGSQVILTPDPYGWTEGGKKREFYGLTLYCEYVSFDYYYDTNNRYMTYKTLILRGAGIEKSVELAFRYRFYTQDGFTNPDSYAPVDSVVYFKDVDGTDLSRDTRYIGSSYCKKTIIY